MTVFVSEGEPPASPVRILVAHNTYQQRGGEDAVVDEEVAMLRRHGHDVHVYLRDNHEINHMRAGRAALDTVWSSQTRREVGALIDEFRPDVLHVHNTFPLISPSVYWIASQRGVPVVQTLHNFRLICPQAMLLRDEKPCEDCVGRTPWAGVRHACYRNSRAHTGALAVMLTSHRLLGTWQRHITRYIALNNFCRDRFAAGGLPLSKLRVKPNCVDLPAPLPNQARSGFLFVGRLSSEKGVRVLCEAARVAGLGAQMRVAGTGPEQHLLEAVTGLQALGALRPDQVYEHMRRSVALVLPSIWYENFPRTLVEAFACGLPVIASRLGAMQSLVDDGRTGLLFNSGDVNDLATKLLWATQHPEQMAVMGAAARLHYEKELTTNTNYAKLVQIYQEAIEAVC